MSNDDLIRRGDVIDEICKLITFDADGSPAREKEISRINKIPAKQSARIAELEAQLARYDEVAIIKLVKGTGLLKGRMLPKARIWLKAIDIPEGTKLFALKDEK
jgi:hypothetical protein